MSSLEEFSTDKPLEIKSLLVLDAQQMSFYRALQEKSPDVAGMYIGVLTVMRQEDNPDRLPQAAHSVRELMEKLPQLLNVPITAMKESLTDRIKTQEGKWQKTITNTTCYVDNEWKGEIDKSLQGFLHEQKGFFEWFAKHYPRRKAEVTKVLRSLDNSRILLPVPLEEENVKIWEKIWTYFVTTAHHRNNTSVDEFNQRLNELERFLLERLMPRTFEDFKTIGTIIAEGEGDV